MVLLFYLGHFLISVEFMSNTKLCTPDQAYQKAMSMFYMLLTLAIISSYACQVS